MEPRIIVLAGIILAGCSVATGAFGAHWLKGELARRELAVDVQQRMLDTWEIAVRYQMYHALGLMAIGLLCTQSLITRGPSTAASLLFLVGVAIFSGCLYALVLSGVKILGAIVPIGGVALIAGWVVLAVTLLRRT